MGNLRLVSLAVLVVLMVAGCGTSDVDEARELAVGRMSTVPLPSDYVLVDSIVEDMDTNAFTRQTGNVTNYWETELVTGPDSFLRIDELLVQSGFVRFGLRDETCSERGALLGYARRDLDFRLTYGFAESSLRLHTNFSETSKDYNHLTTARDWLDELPSCVLEGTP